MNEQIETTEQLYLRLIHKTEDYIEQHLADPIALCDIAKNVHLSEFHFHRIFKAYATETFKEFVTRVKLERGAIFLCVNPAISLTELAFNYGYNSGSSFSRAFKKHFGISPSLYRKQQEMASDNSQSLQ
ncbi:helix-turn-helix transcriptional regulator [Enterococcus asini]|uniref:helix-turn-helix transcriptional regulator n=1 Tax=Enterococcus asini TaxID=57732 RepID=UPI0022E83F40|nr:AraC family transcriptional regulator [Enterococcus asini]